MGTFYFVIAFVVILGFYAFSNIILKKDYVIAGDACGGSGGGSSV